MQLHSTILRTLTFFCCFDEPNKIDHLVQLMRVACSVYSVCLCVRYRIQYRT